MTDPWPCWRCGQPGHRNLGTRGYCREHYLDLVGSFLGVGVDIGPHLQCNRCDATWKGEPGETCPWCRNRRRIQLEHQADLVLKPPTSRTPDTLQAWAERLATAARAGIITADQARNALKRTTAA